jgi:hypothetical protein
MTVPHPIAQGGKSENEWESEKEHRSKTWRVHGGDEKPGILIGAYASAQDRDLSEIYIRKHTSIGT